MMSAFTSLLLACLVIVVSALIVVWTCDCGFIPLRKFAAFVRRPMVEIVLVAAIAFGFIRHGATKGTNGLDENGELRIENGEMGGGMRGLPPELAAMSNALVVTDFAVDTSNKTVVFETTWTNTLFGYTASRNLFLFSSTNLLESRWTPLGSFLMPFGANSHAFTVTTNDVDAAALPWFLDSLRGIGFYRFGVDIDSDGDGLTDSHERLWTFSCPYLPDTDYDGVSDFGEVEAGTNPLVRDTDDDGLVDGSDPDPVNVTPLDDLDGDGIPDAYETHWFGGTNAFNAVDCRDETGFMLGTKILGGMNPTNLPAPASVVSANGLVAWKLFDGFSVEWPSDATNLVWERTFVVNRSSAWQQFFVSASPSAAAGWWLDGMVLEWETDGEHGGCLSESPWGDSFRIPLSANHNPYELTLRLRAVCGAYPVFSPSSLYLIAYVPEFRLEGGSEVTGVSGTKYRVFLDGSLSQIGLSVDHSRRPCHAPPGNDEGNMAWFGGAVPDDSGLSFYGGVSGGSIGVSRPGSYDIPFPELDVAAYASGFRASRPAGQTRSGYGDMGNLVVLSPSVWWACSGHGCVYDGLGYDWEEEQYYEEDTYPLDTKCLRKKWYRDWYGGWYDGWCELMVSSGQRDEAGYVTASVTDGRGVVSVDGVPVWSGTAEHTYGDALCVREHREDNLGDECDDCETDCADGNCDSLEGPSLGSLKFRIPLGAPVKGQVAGFVWFSTDEPIYISKSTFRLQEHPDAFIVESAPSGTRRIVCYDSRGRDLRIENIANGARVTIFDTVAQTLEHTWEIVNENGDPSRIRLRKISRLDNVMSDETFTYDGGDWTRFDNIAGIGTELTVEGDLSGVAGAYKIETRTVTDAAGNILSSLSTTMSCVGECDNAVFRETYRSEWTGVDWKLSQAEYWNDPSNSARHGLPCLIWGNARAWTYMDYDENGHETLRVEQRGDAGLPFEFPYLVSGVLQGVEALSNAFVTVSGYNPLLGDSCHGDDVARPRTVTRYVVTNGVATVVGRTFARYTRLVLGGYDAVKRETWRCGDAASLSPVAGANAYSYEITYTDTGVGTPLLMRNAVAESLDENGALTVNAYSLSDGVLSCETRRYGPDAGGSPTPASALPTYEVTESDASYGKVLRRTTRLTDGDTVIADEQSIYDNQNRLRSTTYLDGTSLTNAYSCCRLLWKRDREGRKTLRSAQTGTDHLYNAMEDVWLGEIENGEWRMENGGGAGNGGTTNSPFKVTQHFYDALGRETNTVVYVGITPGEAATPTGGAQSSATAVSSSIYPYGGSDYSITTDERGKVTVRSTAITDHSHTETTETVSTNGVVALTTKNSTCLGGGSSLRREWVGRAAPCLPGGSPSSATAWSEERRFTDYAPDGRRIERVITESSDNGIVTNSVSTYDLLGRLVTVAVPGANGSTEVTSNFYDGASTRLLQTMTTGKPPVQYAYDELGERIGTIRGDRSVWNVTAYETISQQVYRVVTSVQKTGSATNSIRIQKTQLTGLSDACRRHVVAISMWASPSNAVSVTETTDTFDPDSGVLTSISQTDGQTPVVTRSVHGIPVERTTLDERRAMSYDALGRNTRNVAIDAATGATNRIETLEYDVSGNVTCRTTDYGADGTAVETAEYDMLGREVRRTDSLGQVTETAHDPLGRPVAVGGDTYPLRLGYDTQGRKASCSTTRDGGATWDETRWEYDPASGLNTAKEYADGSRIAYVYADSGLRTRTTWARGAWKENAYNERNLVSGTTYSGADMPSVAYTYHDSDKMASATLSDGTSYAYGYDDSLQCTNETATLGQETFSVLRTYDGLMRDEETSAVLTNVRHSAKTRLYDSESRVCGYALTNAAGRGVSVSLSYAGSYLTNMVYALPNGNTFAVGLTRKASRKHLVSRRDYAFNGSPTYWYSTDYDLLNRPTNATDSASLVREWLYNRRSELAAASIGTNLYGYAYDTIGNRLWAADNLATNTYAANNLNQYSSILRDSASPREPTYDTDGNMTGDGSFAYAYDAENHLVSVTSAAETNGAIRVLNAYDHLNRRIRKTVQRLSVTVAPPPAPPIETREWQTVATHTFVWDGNNIVLEKIQFANGATRTVEYFWGMDKSGTEQGAGGVEGLLAVSVDGVFYIPFYDHNGNIVRYVSETGTIAAQYTYDPYGNVTDTCGDLADMFSFGFSTKYHDRVIGMICYQERVYSPVLGRWLNRDPIEEEGGENLYAFCENDAISKYDALGRNVTLTTGNRNASWWQVGNRFYHQEICVDTWSWNPKSCCWRKSGRSCYSFAATGFGFGGPGSDWLGMNSIKGPGILRGEVYPTGDQGLEDTETLETTPCQDRAFLDYLRSMDGREDTYSLGRHSCRTFSQAMMEEAKRRKNSGGCKNDKKCE